MRRDPRYYPRMPSSPVFRGLRRPAFGALIRLGWLAALASLAGCSLLTIKSPEKPLSARDLNARILMHEYSAHFIGSVQQTADAIAAESEDSQVRLNTLRWKIAAAASSQRAASQIVPIMSLIDSWALSVQMAQYLSTGAGQALFGAHQQQAATLASDLASEAERLAHGLSSAEEFADERRFVNEYAQDHPLESLSFARASLVDLWVTDHGSQFKLTDSLGTVPESLAEARDLMRMYGDTAPAQLLWKAQLAASESGVTGQDLQTALKRLDERMQRLSTMADATPDLVKGVMRDLQTRVDTSWSQMLKEMRTQGSSLSSTLSTERAAATDALDEERAAVMADATRLSAQVIRDAGEQARRLIRETLLLVIVLAVVVMGLPFAAGYLLGRARRHP